MNKPLVNVILVAILASCLVATQATASPLEGKEVCTEATINFDYEFEAAFAVFLIPRCPMIDDHPRIEVHGSFVRTTVTEIQEEQASITCRFGRRCRLPLQLPHPVNERAEYSASFTFRDESGEIVGNSQSTHTCISTSLKYHCL
ncbi:MAG: hypothetical protein QOH21_3518 [Acidobacteriota bacterium]|jgi:hypothetical protein|nr:hypothetical protein [Acidobacteriota bacterium]